MQCELKGTILSCHPDCSRSKVYCEPTIISLNFVNFCCRTSYCNIINDTSELFSSSSPSIHSPTRKHCCLLNSKFIYLLFYIFQLQIKVQIVRIAALMISNTTLLLLRHKGQHGAKPLLQKSNGSASHRDTDITDDSIMDTMTSGSGSGVPRMVERTIAKQIELQEVIGSGRYGQVYLGDYRDEHVAVKIFSTVDEESWKREKDIYSIVLIRHDSILGYVAADMISNNGITELWLITQYHPFGSLYDFLSVSDVKLTPAGMISFVLSICNGLLHLHTEFTGVQSKPAIAHRDLKSKNILVKTNNTCCIADFGLAVYMDVHTRKINLPSTYKNGTVRYLAPEILNNTMDLTIFDSFCNADIYCLALVFWEIGLRTGELYCYIW